MSFGTGLDIEEGAGQSHVTLVHIALGATILLFVAEIIMLLKNIL